MKRLLLMVLLVLLICPAKAQQTSELGTAIEAFMEEHGLNEQNFSMSYYNTVTGESYAFNDKKFMVAASTFKVPVNMYYYELEAAGEIEPDATLPLVGMPLNKAHKLSLVESNNEVSIGMLYSIGDGAFPAYKTKMLKYFTMAEEEIDYIYYADNYYCTHMMMDALKYLYENRELFSEMIGYMKQAQQSEYFCAGVTDYEVAHKYGWFEGAVNDVGIIYTDEPFLLAVYTQDVWESVVGDIAALVTEYNVEKAKPKTVEMDLSFEMVPKEEPEEELPPIAEESPIEEEPTVQETVPELPKEEKEAFTWWMVPVALGVFLLGGGGTLLVTRKKWMQRMLEDEQTDDEA